VGIDNWRIYRTDIQFGALALVTTILLIALGVLGERVLELGELVRVILGLMIIAPISMFLWMFFHCIFSEALRRKWLWLAAFFVGTYLTAAVYYFVIYRRP